MPTSDVLEAIAYVGGLRAVPITAKISQGSAPPYGDAVRDAGFNVLVLCAVEFQPATKKFPGIEVLRCPIADVDMTQAIWTRATRTAQEIAARVQRGQRVLTTCAFGWNRSGLVDALALCELNGISGREAVKRIRKAQRAALYNESFVDALKSIPDPNML